MVLTGLTPLTTYHFRVGATDPSGNAATKTADLTFTTVAPRLVEPWRRSPAWRGWRGDREGPSDELGHRWSEAGYDASAWETVELPDLREESELVDLFYRTRFLWDGQHPVELAVASDDGIEIFVNGLRVGGWGGAWRQPGCVNRGDRCPPGHNVELPPIQVRAEVMQAGWNVIAVRVSNGAGPEMEFDSRLTHAWSLPVPLAGGFAVLVMGLALGVCAALAAPTARDSTLRWRDDS